MQLFKNLAKEDIQQLKKVVLPCKNGKLDKSEQLAELQQIDRFYPNLEVEVYHHPEIKISLEETKQALGAAAFWSSVDRAVFHHSADLGIINGYGCSLSADKAWELEMRDEQELKPCFDHIQKNNKTR